MTTKTEQQSRYVRLSPTVLYRTPSCYGDKVDPLSDACVHCIIKRQCPGKWEVVWR